MQAYDIRSRLEKAIGYVADRVQDFVEDPKRDLTRRRKLPVEVLILHLLTLGAGTIATEIKRLYRCLSDTPVVSAVSQQRTKLKADALRKVFELFTESLYQLGRTPKFLFVAVDGTRITFPDRFRANADYDVWRHRKGKFPLEGHITAAWDINRKMFLDAVIQPLRKINEYAALAELMDRFKRWRNCPVIFIADRGFPSWNVVAHAVRHGHYYLIRTKDPKISKAILNLLPLPGTETFDVAVNVRLVRRKRLMVPAESGWTTVFLRSSQRFDYLPPGSEDTFDLTVRVVRYRLPEAGFASVITNLPKRQFSARHVADLYKKRWGVETAFGQLKAALALESFHTTRPDLIGQEVWAKFAAFNYVSAMRHAAQRLADAQAKESRRAGVYCKHRREVDFTAACGAALSFLIPGSGDYDDAAFLESLSRRRHAVRKKRKTPARGKVNRRTPIASTHRPAV